MDICIRSRARHLFLPQLGSRTTIKQYRLVRNRNLLGHDDNIFCCYEKIQKSGEIWSYVSLFLFQDSLEVVLFIFVHFDITGTRNTFKGYKNVWKLKITIQNFERSRIYSLYTQHLSTCHVMSPLYVYRKVSFQHISNEVRWKYYNNSHRWSSQSRPRQVTGLSFIHKLKMPLKWPCDYRNNTSSC